MMIIAFIYFFIRVEHEKLGDNEIRSNEQGTVDPSSNLSPKRRSRTKSVHVPHSQMNSTDNLTSTVNALLLEDEKKSKKHIISGESNADNENGKHNLEDIESREKCVRSMTLGRIKKKKKSKGKEQRNSTSSSTLLVTQVETFKFPEVSILILMSYY